MKFLLITPPLTQLNTPYPATAVLKGWLQAQGYEAVQADLGIETVDRLFTAAWLRAARGRHREYMLAAAEVVEPVMRFLRGEDATVAWRIVNGSLLPEGPRFDNIEDMEWAFGTAGVADRARYLATLFLEDVADAIREEVDGHFGLVNYAEHLANYAPTFDELAAALQRQPSEVDALMLDLLKGYMERERPEVVCLSVPFPGCLYGALRCGQWLRREWPGVKVCIGGGFVNTEWRQLHDERLFDYCHFITLDDGELPLQRIAEWLQGRCTERDLVRTMWRRDNGTVVWQRLNEEAVVENGWHRCAFCDTTLDYIGRFAPPKASKVVDMMERVMAQTGVSGFHFVDEALPPKLLREVCEEIVKRGLMVTFWGNIRFEKAYTAEMCDLLSQAGCVAVSGGLEVASDRLLQLMDKGVTIEQTMQACRHFRDAGIMVHTYLMYGFPTETLQETLGALDTVRRMFDEGIVQSAFWHRYAMTCHSPSGQHPERYGARRCSDVPNTFCNNEVDWEPLHGGEQFDYDIDEVGRGLRVATYNYMNGLGLDQPVRSWFPGIRFKKPKKS